MYFKIIFNNAVIDANENMIVYDKDDISSCQETLHNIAFKNYIELHKDDFKDWNLDDIEQFNELTKDKDEFTIETIGE